VSKDKPKYPLGSVVRVLVDFQQMPHEPEVEMNLKGWCDLFVVGITETPSEDYYTLSDIPVRFPLEGSPITFDKALYRTLANLVETRPASELQPTGKPSRKLMDVDSWDEPVPAVAQPAN
jgi:hypothetical protein